MLIERLLQMGGAFTQHLTWRWCFYINLPIGGVTAAGLVFLLRLQPAKRNGKVPLMAVFKMLDPVGNSIFVPAIICLLLALQWGGVTYAWSDARIIARKYSCTQSLMLRDPPEKKVTLIRNMLQSSFSSA